MKERNHRHPRCRSIKGKKTKMSWLFSANNFRPWDDWYVANTSSLASFSSWLRECSSHRKNYERSSSLSICPVAEIREMCDDKSDTIDGSFLTDLTSSVGFIHDIYKPQVIRRWMYSLQSGLVKNKIKVWCLISSSMFWALVQLHRYPPTLHIFQSCFRNKI